MVSFGQHKDNLSDLPSKVIIVDASIRAKAAEIRVLQNHVTYEARIGEQTHGNGDDEWQYKLHSSRSMVLGC